MEDIKALIYTGMTLVIGYIILTFNNLIGLINLDEYHLISALFVIPFVWLLVKTRVMIKTEKKAIENNK